MANKHNPIRVTHLSRRELFGYAGGGIAAFIAREAFLPRQAWATTPTVRTLKPGVLTAACTGDMPLTSTRDGKLVGTDFEMLQLITNRLGLKLDAQLMGFPAVVEAVQSGRADWFGGNFAWTPIRSRVLPLTDAVFYTGAFAVMRKNEPITTTVTVADFKGRTVGSGIGFSTVPDLKRVPGVVEVKLYDGIDPCVRDVVAGRLDFAVLDAPIVDYMISQNPNWNLKQLPIATDAEFPTLTNKYSAIWGINPNEPDLFDAINQGIRWLWSTRQIGPILSTYGLDNVNYLMPPQKNPRLGVDRDTNDNPIGTFAHKPRDFSALFS